MEEDGRTDEARGWREGRAPTGLRSGEGAEAQGRFLARGDGRVISVVCSCGGGASPCAGPGGGGGKEARGVRRVFFGVRTVSTLLVPCMT